MVKKVQIQLLLLCFIQSIVFSQGFLRTDGKKIINDGGEVLLRSINLGGWMLQEGYMMQTSSFANPQHEIKSKIQALIGAENTEQFYEAWLDNYCRKIDVDSMAAWGFNSIRLPMHYNLFTLPIEEEPVQGQHTWLDKGFELTDKLLAWCESNQVYVILDLHGAPGGQGKEAAISDYDDSKPSLWESPQNRAKTVALWRKLAERYAKNEWIGGYDLINETNWNMTGNKMLKDLYVEITNAIREVDSNHIIYIEGNWFANDFNGLTPPWDGNMVYSFHKYWSHNDQGSIQWVLDMRNRHNIPLWCGESGENSNVWFRDAIRLLEENNIGWAWWPLKKIESISCPLSIPKSPEYQRLLDYWEGNASKPSASVATKTLMDLTELMKLENCDFQKDVIDAMFRQVQSDELLPWTNHNIPGLIFASDYDLGRNGFAYFDSDTADYHVSTGSWTGWNSGWAYRNDGVDVEPCDDSKHNNGFSVGYTDADEWMNYTVNIENTAAYDVTFRVASEQSSGSFHLELDDRFVSGVQSVTSTGGWYNWRDLVVQDVILEAGRHVFKIYFDNGPINLNYFEFFNPHATEQVACNCLAATGSADGKQISVTLNKKIQSPLPAGTGGFLLKVNNIARAISGIQIDASGYRIDITPSEKFYYEDTVTLSYSGTQIRSIDGSLLQVRQNLPVRNTQPTRHQVPGKIEAESFDFNNGLVLENTTDTGGGQNLGYTHIGDYVDYRITVETAGTYEVDYRVAALSTSGQIELYVIDGDQKDLLHTVTLPITGGWQSWETVSKSAVMPEGRYTIRLRVKRTEFNLNWFRFRFITDVAVEAIAPTWYGLSQNYPNPFNPVTKIPFALARSGPVSLRIFNLRGEQVETLLDEKRSAGEHVVMWRPDGLASGIFLVRLNAGTFTKTRKLILQR